MPERLKTRDEELYWDAIAKHYHRITRIDCRDFHYGPQIPGERHFHFLPEFPRGAAALELGCGAAQNSIWLARRGLACTALDVSEGQLAYARRLAAEQGVAITLARAPLDSFRKALPRGARFDFVHSSHAMEFAEHPDRVVQAMAAVLKPGGTLMISTVHPLFNGSWVTGMVEDDAGKVYDGQFLTDYFSPPDDVYDDHGGHCVSRAYPVESWFGWLRAAGLEVTVLAEPRAVRRAPYTSYDWAHNGGQLDHIPATILFLARKPAAGE